jgi:hypothetical protein
MQSLIARSCPGRAHSGELEEDVPRETSRTTGDDVNLTSYLPTTFTTLFVLAAGLLLGYIQ